MKNLNEQFEEAIFCYLDRLRESGVVNMYGACPYLMIAFGLEHKEAQVFLSRWMNTFGERHNGKE